MQSTTAAFKRTHDGMIWQEGHFDDRAPAHQNKRVRMRHNQADDCNERLVLSQNIQSLQVLISKLWLPTQKVHFVAAHLDELTRQIFHSDTFWNHVYTYPQTPHFIADEYPLPKSLTAQSALMNHLRVILADKVQNNTLEKMDRLSLHSFQSAIESFIEPQIENEVVWFHSNAPEYLQELIISQTKEQIERSIVNNAKIWKLLSKDILTGFCTLLQGENNSHHLKFMEQLKCSQTPLEIQNCVQTLFNFPFPDRLLIARGVTTIIEIHILGTDLPKYEGR